MTYVCYAIFAQILASLGLLISIIAPMMVRYPLPESRETKASRYRLLTPRKTPPKPPVELTSDAPIAQRSPSMPRRHTLHSMPSAPFCPSDAPKPVLNNRRDSFGPSRIFGTRPFTTKASVQMIPQMSRITSAGSDVGSEEESSPAESDLKSTALLVHRAASVVPIRRARNAIRRSFSLAQPPTLPNDTPPTSKVFPEVPTPVQPNPSSAQSKDQCKGELKKNGASHPPSDTQDDATTTSFTLLKAARTRTQTALRKTASSAVRVYTRKKGRSAFRCATAVDRT